MKKILVAGAYGYLGAKISKYLAQKGNRVTAFGHSTPSENTQWSSLMDEVIIGDIRNESIILKLAEKKYDVLINLISLDHHKSENKANFVSSINVLPSWNLLEKLSKSGLKKFIYFSACQVYGKIPFKEITEDFIPSPQNTYGLTHLLSENICNYYNKKTNINCINVRLSSGYGSPIFWENNCWWLVINDFCKTAFSEKKIKLLSEGAALRDFIHNTDVVRAIEILVDTDKKYLQNNTYHISSGKTLNILKLAHTVKIVYQKRYQHEIQIILPDNSISVNPNKFLKTERYTINNSKLKLLGFIPRVDLKTGINEIFDYLENNYENNCRRI